MKKAHRYKHKALVLLLGVLAWGAAVDAQQVENIPARQFEALGIMNYLDIPGGTVSIDGKLYRLSPRMKWYGLPDSKASLVRQSIRLVDRPVRYIPAAGKNTPTVDAILILPMEAK